MTSSDTINTRDLLLISDLPAYTGLAANTIRYHRHDATSKSPFPAPRWNLNGIKAWHRNDVTNWLNTRDTQPGQRAATP